MDRLHNFTIYIDILLYHTIYLNIRIYITEVRVVHELTSCFRVVKIIIFTVNMSWIHVLATT